MVLDSSFTKSSDLRTLKKSAFDQRIKLRTGFETVFRNIAEREQRSLKLPISLYVEIFHCWMEYEQQVIIRLLLREDATADDIHRRLQAQFTDNADSIRSVRSRCQLIRQEREDLHDDPRSGRPPIEVIHTKILSALKREPFHSAHSLGEVVGVSCSTVIYYLRDSLGMKNFHLR
jgi:hypothetical protein